MKNIAQVQGPLNKLTSTRVDWKWTDVEGRSFIETKKSILQAATLALPELDHPYRLYMDTSNTGLGAILTQYDSQEDREILIVCLSRPLNKAKTNYTTTEKECLAVVWA